MNFETSLPRTSQIGRQSGFIFSMAVFVVVCSLVWNVYVAVLFVALSFLVKKMLT